MIVERLWVSLLHLEPLLGEGVVGGEGGGEDGRHHEGQDVQAVQQDLRDGTLGGKKGIGCDVRTLSNASFFLYYSIW